MTKALRRVYGKSETRAWKELKSLKLFPGEPVDVLADQVTTLLSVAAGGNSVPGELAAAFVLDALPPTIAEQVRLQYGEEMNLQSVISGAKTLLAGLDDHNTAGAAATARSVAIDAERRSVTSDERRTTAKLRCYGCNRMGHVRRTCPTVCYGCGERGHLQRSCPSAVSGNDKARMAPPGRAALAEEP